MPNALLILTAAFAAGIWAAPRVWLSASEEVFAISACLLGAAVLLRGGRFPQGFLLALPGFFLCGAFLAAWQHGTLSPRHIDSLVRQGTIRAGEPLTLTGWVRTGTVADRGRNYFDLQLTAVEQGGARFAAEGVVRVYEFREEPPATSEEILYGGNLSLSLRGLRRPRNYGAPGSFDWEDYLRRRDIRFTGLRSDADAVRVLPGRSGSLWRALADRLSRRLLAHLDALYVPPADAPPTAAILKATLLGDASSLQVPDRVVFEESGIYHVLVVSGLHAGALSLGLFWILSRLRLADWLKTALTLACLGAYTLLVGAGIPTLRAALMIALYLLARLIYRQRALLNAVAAAALALLAVHPQDLRETSFQLSFFAVLLIAAIAVPILQRTLLPCRAALRDLDAKEKDLRMEPCQAQFRHDVRVLLDYACDPARLALRRWRLWRAVLTKAAAGLLATGDVLLFVLLMQAGLSLLTVLYFHRHPAGGLLANIIAMPLCVALIPLGFVTLAAAEIWWPLAQALAWPLEWLVRGLYWAAWQGFVFPWFHDGVPDPPRWLLLFFLATLLAAAVALDRRWRWAGVAVTALIGLAVVLGQAPYRPRLMPGKLEVTLLDVGQGDSIFVAFPEGKTMLIDGGGALQPDDPERPRFAVGQQVVSPYLWSRQLQAIDVLVLTHAHADHMTGLFSVLGNFRVGELWVGPGGSSPALKELLQGAADSGVPVVRMRGDSGRVIDGVEVRVFSPPPDWKRVRVSNDDSLVLRLNYQGRSVLLPGDIEGGVEERLAGDSVPLASDILKIAHHGSKTSTTPAFLSRVQPRFGLLSVGAYGRFGHPDTGVLERLRQEGVQVYGTHQKGSITVTTDGHRIEIATFRDALRPWAPFPLLPATSSWRHPRSEPRP